MAGQPIIPGSPSNPVGQVPRIRKASAAIDRILQAVKRWLLDEFDRIPVTTVTVSAAAGSDIITNDTSYKYQIDLANLWRIVGELHQRLQEGGGAAVVDEAVGAYEEGTGLAVVNLANITDDYTREITMVLSSAAYMRRASLVRARVFEQMEGFAGEAGRDLGRILFEAIESGLNPRAVRDTLAERFDISKGRAERIARTEITGALRRGRLDEALDAQEHLGIKIGMIWKSALSPSTRASHAARHGNVYPVQEVREFYARDGNQINCKCAPIEGMLDADGNPAPATAKVQARLKAQREAAVQANNKTRSIEQTATQLREAQP